MPLGPSVSCIPEGSCHTKIDCFTFQDFTICDLFSGLEMFKVLHPIAGMLYEMTWNDSSFLDIPTCPSTLRTLNLFSRRVFDSPCVAQGWCIGTRHVRVQKPMCRFCAQIHVWFGGRHMSQTHFSLVQNILTWLHFPFLFLALDYIFSIVIWHPNASLIIPCTRGVTALWKPTK